jgi:putative transposase
MPSFLTVTCLEWKPLLANDNFKDHYRSLTYLTAEQRIKVYAFVIMANHFHLTWQMLLSVVRKSLG